MNKLNRKILITTGDVNGIGAEITIKALNKLDLPSENVLIVSNKAVLDFYGKLDKDYEIINVDFDAKNVTPGKITPESGDFSFKLLEKACEISKDKGFNIVTAPVAKVAMHKAGHFYNGQTEVIESFLKHDNQNAEMLFAAKDFRVLLLTRHVALKQIEIAEDLLIEKISDLSNFFKQKFKINSPKFALCALNPHAGEDGIIGGEEKDIILPAVSKLQSNGIDVSKPLPADTLFIDAAKAYLSNQKMPFDCYIAMYHDQGLIPIKTVAADKTVNMTIGLDVIRTSPCHGTAFDIAGKNLASENSMIEAILQALKV